MASTETTGNRPAGAMDSTEAASDCRFPEKAAVRRAGATESRALTRGDEAPAANPDCRFPPPGHDAPASSPRALEISAQAPPAAGHTPCQQRGAPCAPTGATTGPSGPTPASARPDATSGNVARDGANLEGHPPALNPPFSAPVRGAPTSVSHRTHPGEMDARRKCPDSRNPEFENAARKMWSSCNSRLSGAWLVHGRLHSPGCVCGRRPDRVRHGRCRRSNSCRVRPGVTPRLHARAT